MIEPIEMNVDFSTQDTEMNVEADMNCRIEIPLPIASATTLGGIKVGENLNITEDGTLSADGSGTQEEIEQLQEDVAQLENALKAIEIVDTASGAIVSFPDGGDGFAVRDLKVQMEPVQDLHGYDHPWPAGGGKNQANLDATFPITSQGITITKNDDGSITIDGTAEANSNINLMNPKSIANGAWTISGVPSGTPTGLNIWVRNISEGSEGSEFTRTYNGNSGTVTITTETIYIYCTVEKGITLNNVKVFLQLEAGSTATPWSPYSNICPISGRDSVTVTRTGKNLFGGTFNEFFPLHFESDKTVIVSADAVGSGTPQMGFYDENEVRIDWCGMDSAHSSVSGRVARVIELPKESYYVKFIGDESTRYMIELANTNTPFESYVGNTYNITFPSEAGTVYGGTLDVTQGVLTVDTAYDVYDGSSDEIWVDVSDGYAIKNDLTRGNAIPITNMFPGGIRGTIVATDTFYNSNATYNYRLGLSDSSVTDLASFKVWLSNNPIQVCCKLAQPVTVQLAPQQVTTLLGQNNVWSDADSVSVDYVADTKLYIEQLTEPDADMVADMNITSGKYFMVGNTLYLATANIANGAAITVGVNCTRTNLAEALNAINS